MKFTVIENNRLKGATWLMRLQGDTSAIKRPGQFVNIQIDGCFLRRPISVCDWDDSSILLAYDVVGAGTEKMSQALPQQEFDVLSGLGNGFDLSVRPEQPVLLGGGIGVAPLYGLAKRLIDMDIQPVAILGFNNAHRVVMDSMFSNLGIETFVATVDGSQGTRGFVTDALKKTGIKPDYFYACGPQPMMKALCRDMSIPGELSLETRMACGFGICACCAINTSNGPAGVCKKGPVFKKNDIVWDD